MTAKRLFFSVSLPLLLALPPAARAADEASQLIEVLRSRAGMVRTFQADVTWHEANRGPDCQAFAESIRRRMAWYKKHGRSYPASSMELMAKTAENPAPPETRYFRYFSQASGLIRREWYERLPPGNRSYDHVDIFTGERWETFGPTKQPQGKKYGYQHDLLVSAKGVEGFQIEIAWGAGVSPDYSGILKEKRSIVGQVAGYVAWEEYLNSLPLSSAQAGREPLVAGGPALPYLVLNHPPLKGTNQARGRLWVWFDDSRSYLPLRFEQQSLRSNKMTGEYYYLPERIVECSEPITLSDGMVFAQTVVIRDFWTDSPMVEGVPPEKWPTRSYEIQKTTCRFTNVRVNGSLDASLFKAPAPVGTYVVDEIAHETYITGPAGQQLHKMALQSREDFPPPMTSTGHLWWYMAGGLISFPPSVSRFSSGNGFSKGGRHDQCRVSADGFATWRSTARYRGTAL